MSCSSLSRRRQLLQALTGRGLSVVSAPAFAADAIAVVTGSSSRQRISGDRLRRVFLALPTDGEDGRRFLPIHLSQSTSARARFDRVALEISPEEVARCWLPAKVVGSGAVPG